LIFGITVNGPNTVVTVDDPKCFGVQDEHRVGDIVEDFMVLFFRFLQFVFQLFSLRNIQAHFHGRNDIALPVFDRRCSDNPMGRRTIFVDTALLAIVGEAIVKRFFHRAIRALLIPPFIGVIAEITPPDIKALGKFVVIS